MLLIKYYDLSKSDIINEITNSPGTRMYHTHYNSSRQEMMGLGGAFIILDPSEQYSLIQYDYFIMLQEFYLKGLDKGQVTPGVYDKD